MPTTKLNNIAADKTVLLCCELLSRESLTPKDADCQSLMIRRLEDIGFDCQLLPFGDVKNFWAEHGSSGPILVFAGHTDVVPTGPPEQWSSPPFEPTLRNGILYGRGSADMKGSLAAMVTACEEFVAEFPDHQGRIGFLITSDEEGPAINGTVKVMEFLQNNNKPIDWCIVGEPSSSEQLGDVIKNGRRGSLGAILTINGIQGHIAYPHLADNPIHSALSALQALTEEVWDRGNEFFPPTSMQISNIHSGTGVTNVIPGTMEVQFNFRFSTQVTETQLRERSEEILARHGVNYTIQWNLSGQPFITGSGDLVEATQGSIKEITGLDAKLSTAGGTSDGRFIAPTGAQVLELGPINASIHKVDEHVIASDLPRLSAIYKGIMKRLLL